MMVGRSYDYEKKQKAIREQYGDFAESGYYVLFPTIPDGDDDNNAARSAAAQVRKAEHLFYEQLSGYLKSTVPYSFLACVSVFPLSSEKLIEYDLLISLLCDCGLLFREVRPHDPGQYSMRDLSSIFKLDSNEIKRTATLKTVEWTESEMIDEAVKRIMNEFRCPNEPDNSFPKILLKVEERADPENVSSSEGDRWIRRYVRNRFTGKEKENLPNGLKEYLDRPIFDEDAIPASGPLTGMRIYRNIIDRFDAICDEIEHEHISAFQKINTVNSISKEAYQRFHQAEKNEKMLRQDLDILKKVPLDIRNRLEEWLQNPNGSVDDIDRDARDEGWIKERKRKVIHIDRISQYFPEPGDIQELSRSIFTVCNKWMRDQGMPLKKTQQNCDLFRRVIHFSLWEQFVVFSDDESGEEAGILFSFAPIILYLIIFSNKDKIYNEKFEKIDPAIFEADKQSSPTIDQAKRDFLFFKSLCKVYSKYYGKHCTDEMKSAWNYAFLRYSGYMPLLGQPAAYRALRDFSEQIFPFPFRCIRECIQANRIIPLSHNPVIIKPGVLDQFHPQCEGDPGWEVVTYFRALLQNEQDGHVSKWVSQYRERLLDAASDKFIYEFLDDCLKEICSEEFEKGQMVLFNNYEKLYDKLNLDGVFTHPPIRPMWKQAALCAALEYTLRLILADKCHEILFQLVDGMIKELSEEYQDEEMA